MGKDPYLEKIGSDRFSPWKRRRPLLGHLDIELTERCNNNCIHCYINLPAQDQAAKGRELSTEAWKRILKEAARLGCLQVRFTGGEPLLRDDFEDLYVFARRLGIKVILSTNATLINPSVADLLRRIPPLEKVDVTLYGMKRTSYEAVSRTPGSFEAAMRGIGLLLEKGVLFDVKGILLPATEDETEAFEAWRAALPGTDEPPSYVVFLDLRAWGGGEKNEDIRRLRTSPEKGLHLVMKKREAYLEAKRKFCSAFMAAAGRKLFPCGAGMESGSVNAYGGFQPCLQLRHPDAIFDLKQGSIEEALRVFFPALRRRRSGNPDYLKRCARCFLKGLCDQCPAKSWMEHGTLDTPVDYLCDIAHLEARELGLLGEGEKAWEVKDAKARLEALRVKMKGREP